MYEVGAFEAKTHLPQLLDRVSQHGEEILITRHGKPVARLVGVEMNEEDRRRKAKQAAAKMRLWRKKHGPTLGKAISIKELIEEGRR